jgi:hypothetical protein
MVVGSLVPPSYGSGAWLGLAVAKGTATAAINLLVQSASDEA